MTDPYDRLKIHNLLFDYGFSIFFETWAGLNILAVDEQLIGRAPDNFPLFLIKDITRSAYLTVGTKEVIKGIKVLDDASTKKFTI